MEIIMRILLLLLLSTSLAWSAQVGDTRTTKDGFEKCIVDGRYETWALIEPSAEYLAKAKSDNDTIEAIEAEAQKQSQLDELDRKSVRALRAVLTAEKEGKEPNKVDIDKLKELEAQAQAIRGK